MKYQDAIKIGSVLDGYIRCTYMELFDAPEQINGSMRYRKLFSLQAKFITHEHYYVPVSNPENIGVEVLFPVVVTEKDSGYAESNKYVPVYLDTRAAKYILSKCWKRDENSAYAIIMARLENGEPFYVEKDAIDWMPQNLDNTTEVDDDGIVINVSEELEEARKKMENAKAILIAAGGSLLL